MFGYTTAGGESLSLLGQSRSFPSSTHMIVTDGPDACSDVSWVPITEHTESMTVCPFGSSSALGVTDFTTFEQISGTSTTTVLECPATTYLVPPLAVPGARWSSTCVQSEPAAPAQHVTIDGLVLGTDPIDVGTQSVPSLHVRLTIHFGGLAQGLSPTDLWISTSRGVITREQETTTVAQDGVHYTERMDCRLVALDPLT